MLAQIVYYGYASLRHSEPVTFCVPTGNFGNVFAGYLARKMGFPIKDLLVATNENDILARFFATGEYSRGDVHFTLSPAMATWILESAHWRMHPRRWTWASKSCIRRVCKS